MQRAGRSRVQRALPVGRAARALGAAAVLLLAPGVPRALECPAPGGADPRLASVPAERRIAALRLRLEAGRPSAEAWTWTWGVVDGGLTVAQLAAIPLTSSRSARWVLAVGAASSALGVLQVVAFPIVPEQVPAGADGCDEVAALERSLDRAAENVELGSGWVAQVGNVAVNAVVGALAGAADGRWQTGAWTFGLGWAVGEVQILTMPMGLARDRERYRAGGLPGVALSPGAPRLTAAVRPRSRGATLSLSIRF